MEKIFKIIELQRYREKINHDILFVHGHWSIWKSPENGYTALHWAVHHNNNDICRLFVIFIETLDYIGSSACSYGGNSPIYRERNKNNLLPFELALSLEHNDCARNIALGMTLDYIEDNTKDEFLCKALLLNIKVICKYSAYNDVSILDVFIPDVFFKTPDKKKMVFNHILNLPNENKKQALELMVTEGSMLYQFFSIENKNEYSKKALNALIQMNKEKQAKPYSPVTLTVQTSISGQSLFCDPATKDRKELLLTGNKVMARVPVIEIPKETSRSNEFPGLANHNALNTEKFDALFPQVSSTPLNIQSDRDIQPVMIPESNF